ncbi:potassium transporter Kup [Arenibaculum pallidiluteum]|uniref:potassium transporter Kup n=1 Tax=Arenibaculum pallidiluteum TaxID=2812559 RepID=UPI001A964E66|nr:potassium transporter Kup [Arenibaculum pallidiluteum]
MTSQTLTPDAAEHRRSSFGTLLVGAIGVVFGDIGTSPLYAIKETFAGPHPLVLDRAHVLGVLSLVFWSLMVVVSIKYVALIMRADNRGEGGSLALLALLGRAVERLPGLAAAVGACGIFAAALFYGDSVITPAISVLSAVEGLQVGRPELASAVEPLTLVVLVLLFMIQRHGSAMVGKLFGPVMLLWFLTLAWLGIANIGNAPGVLLAVSPHYALSFIAQDGFTAFLAFGSVVLAVTGAEALYADMGHFGKLPIRLAWYLLVWPSLLLNYFGQGALLLSDPGAVENPFFRMAPDWAALPLVGLATAAAVIASQAVITGAFSVTRQAIQLGYLPRMTIIHTSEREIGQIYLPFVNWMLLAGVTGLVLGFQSSSNLASAYGIAVTGTMLITSVMLGFVMVHLWGWRKRIAMIAAGSFALVDLAFFLANATKITHGGWFPLAVGVVLFTVLRTWKRGRDTMRERIIADAPPAAEFIGALSGRAVRVKGTAVFLTSAADGVPPALLHNLKHNQVLHERVVLLKVVVSESPTVPPERRVEAEKLSDGLHRILLNFGFMEDPDVPKALANAKRDELGFFYEPLSTSYFLSREIVVPAGRSSLPPWRAKTFAVLSRAASSAPDYFRLPVNRVLELGTQVEI